MWAAECMVRHRRGLGGCHRVSVFEHMVCAQFSLSHCACLCLKPYVYSAALLVFTLTPHGHFYRCVIWCVSEERWPSRGISGRFVHIRMSHFFVSSFQLPSHWAPSLLLAPLSLILDQTTHPGGGWKKENTKDLTHKIILLHMTRRQERPGSSLVAPWPESGATLSRLDNSEKCHAY